MLDVGVIGVGAMGKNHARVYSELKNVNEVFIFDLNEKLENIIGAKACPSVGELLENVDAVSICVPTQYHYGVAKKVIETNTPFLIEKPICETLSDAKQLIDITQKDWFAVLGKLNVLTQL